MLGDGSDVGTDSHEVMVALPARHKVKVQMLADTGTSCLSKVETDIDAVGVKMPTEYGAACCQHGHEAAVFFSRELCKIGEVSAWSDEQVPVGIGIPIEEDNSQIVAVKEQVGLILWGCSQRFKKTAVNSRHVTKNMLHSPGGPQSLHGMCGTSKIRAESWSPASSIA